MHANAIVSEQMRLLEMVYDLPIDSVRWGQYNDGQRFIIIKIIENGEYYQKEMRWNWEENLNEEYQTLNYIWMRLNQAGNIRTRAANLIQRPSILRF